jgi:hypothetical protein
MICDAPSDRRSGFWTARPRASRPLPQDRLAQRRREIAALLEEIRDPASRPAGAGDGHHGARTARAEAPIPVPGGAG